MTNSKNNSEIKELSLKESLEQYTRYWPLFILAVLAALFCAYLYLRYTTPSYETNSTIIIKDERKGGGAAELAAFSELSFFSNAFSDKIDSELVILSSKSLIAKAVKSLGLNIQYLNKGAIKTSELYAYKPFKVTFLNVSDTTNVLLPPPLTVTAVSSERFKLEIASAGISNEHTFGDKIEFPFGDIVVLPSLTDMEKFESYFNRPIQIVYNSVARVAASYQGSLKLLHDGKSGEVVKLQMKSAIPKKAEDFLNELVYQYNQDAINDRSQVAQKTSKFIDSRLQIITRELDSVERNKELFKSKNRLTDIEAEAQLVLQNANEFNKRQIDVSTQLELINSMVDYMNSSSKADLLPANIGTGPEVSSSVNSYNQLVLERNRLLESSTERNPIVVNLDSQIDQLRSSIKQSLSNQQRSYQVAIKDLNIQENRFNSKLSSVPTQEKLFRGIVRQQNIKEQLYLFLLQQREETSISLAVTSSKAKVVDSAYSGKTPVSPKRSLIYLLAFITGILVPFILLYVYYLLNTKIANRRDVERVHTQTPFIGEVPKLSRGDEELIQHNDRSILAESFRIVRTNLQYLLSARLKNSKSAKNIFVTSTIKGEGKTFVAFNLALTLAQTGKRVVLVGADIRNPQLHRYLSEDQKSKKGLTEYIVDPTLKVLDLVEPSPYSNNLSIVLSGVIPPNPAELLMQPRTELFFDELKEHFDYIIVDTAPSMLVTDTILINNLSDVTIYVVRANYTDKKLLEFPLDAINDGRLSNVAIVLNNVTLNNFGYGNKYGYTYTAEKKSFWKRLFS